MLSRAFALAILMLAMFVLPARAAVELITNGGFETGDFTGWTVANQAGGSGDFYLLSGTTLPLSGLSTVGPSSGIYYASSDQGGPGTHALLQTFSVPLGTTSVTLSFDMFVNDWDSGPIVGAQGLDFNGGANQIGRVDILSVGSGSFDTGAGVLANLYLSVDGGSDPNPYTGYVFDISSIALAGNSYVLRFAEVDNQLFLSQGVDNVSILADGREPVVPEPASLLVWSLLGVTLWGTRRWRSR